MRLHHLLPVHHRLLRNLRRISIGISHIDPLHRIRSHDGRCDSVVWESGSSLHMYDIGMHKRSAGTCAVRVFQVWT